MFLSFGSSFVELASQRRLVAFTHWVFSAPSPDALLHILFFFLSILFTFGVPAEPLDLALVLVATPSGSRDSYGYGHRNPA